MNKLQPHVTTSYLRVMGLTVEHLLTLLQANYPHTERFTLHTELRDESIDGDDAVELLALLEQHFGVSFDNFPFRQYFLEEIEIARSLSWFGLKRVRTIETELTVHLLYDYMREHAK
ncbi:DUF1493 family protein [Hymenobacter artigasi]|uniref:DUF1493 family protein n=1 Tax=Hymenobacter artigasi TaxID=2719616 RepID=A0ABX1HPX6_9BACT|nr:DUF1493 family protein [Hymenobacter artigasi]NKI92024.1 hypothetical protein [Hymenobacter artigasi]